MSCRVTNMKKVKELAKSLFDAVKIEPDEEKPCLCFHPFTNDMSPFVRRNVKGVDAYIKSLPKQEQKKMNEIIDERIEVDLNNDLGKEVFRNNVFAMIDRSESVRRIYTLIIPAFYTTFFQGVEPYLSKKDAGEMLSESWVGEEYPNMCSCVTIPEFIKYFRNADKKSLMDEDELVKFNEIRAKASSRDGIKLYRGVTFDGEPDGLSWTTDLKIAQWFANRWEKTKKVESNPRVYEITVKNSNSILAYFGRGESEVILDTSVEQGWKLVNKN